MPISIQMLSVLESNTRFLPGHVEDVTPIRIRRRSGIKDFVCPTTIQVVIEDTSVSCGCVRLQTIHDVDVNGTYTFNYDAVSDENICVWSFYPGTIGTIRNYGTEDCSGPFEETNLDGEYIVEFNKNTGIWVVHFEDVDRGRIFFEGTRSDNASVVDNYLTCGVVSPFFGLGSYGVGIDGTATITL